MARARVRLRRLLSTPEGKVGAACASVLVLIALVGGAIDYSTSHSSKSYAGYGDTASSPSQLVTVGPCQQMLRLMNSIKVTLSKAAHDDETVTDANDDLSNEVPALSTWIDNNSSVIDATSTLHYDANATLYYARQAQSLGLAADQGQYYSSMISVGQWEVASVNDFGDHCE